MVPKKIGGWGGRGLGLATKTTCAGAMYWACQSVSPPPHTHHSSPTIHTQSNDSVSLRLGSGGARHALCDTRADQPRRRRALVLILLPLVIVARVGAQPPAEEGALQQRAQSVLVRYG